VHAADRPTVPQPGVVATCVRCRLPRSPAGRGRRVAALVVAVAVSLAGCGNDDDDDAAESGVAADSAAPAACNPVGEELRASATRTISMELRDFSFSPATVETAPGVVTFAARNVGSENHEVAFLPGGGQVPLAANGEPDEDALAAAGAFELEAFGPGRDCSATYDLKPGTYTLFCIVTSEDGQTHYEKGMRGQLVVR
jgi:plastocyanin